MIKPEQVPNEVIRAYVHEITYGSEHVPGAIAAAINAWPGMTYERLRFTGDIGLILPLSQEGGDE